MKFKHQEFYNELKDCPPSHYSVKEILTAYRWVFEEIKDKRNFTSQYHKKPSRFLSQKDAVKCQALALSMFDNIEAASARFQALKRYIGDNIYKTLGTKIAVGKVKITDGVCSNTVQSRHFSVHPSATADFNNSFQLTQQKL